MVGRVTAFTQQDQRGGGHQRRAGQARHICGADEEGQPWKVDGREVADQQKDNAAQIAGGVRDVDQETRTAVITAAPPLGARPPVFAQASVAPAAHYGRCDQ